MINIGAMTERVSQLVFKESRVCWEPVKRTVRKAILSCFKRDGLSRGQSIRVEPRDTSRPWIIPGREFYVFVRED